MYVPPAPPKDLAEAVASLDARPGETVLVLVGEEDAPDLGALRHALTERGVPFFGGVFPGLIHAGRRYARGMVVHALPLAEPPRVVTGLDSGSLRFPSGFGRSVGHDALTALVLTDGLTSNIALFLSRLYDRLGSRVNTFGGGAGSLSLSQRPCLFTPEGIFQDAAIVAFLPLGSRLGVHHGWDRLSGPFVATRTERNVIRELNWETAFDVYRDVVGADARTTLSAGSFFTTAKGYPFGMSREGHEDVVRDPIAVDEDGGLVCVGEVTNNAVLYLLKGCPDALIGSARQAARDALGSDGRPRLALVADCISRVLFLEDQFEDELIGISREFEACGLTPPDGMLTIGEISSYGEGLLELYNKTTVVTTLHG